MVEYALEERRRDPLIRYVELTKRVRKRFGTSKSTAEAAIAQANRTLKEEFTQFAEDAALSIAEFYREQNREAMSAYMAARADGDYRACATLLSVAGRAMDSMRDMFGLTNTINVYLNGSGPPPSVFAAMTDEELAIAAKLDRALPAGQVIEAQSTEVDADDQDDDEEPEVTSP